MGVSATDLFSAITIVVILGALVYLAFRIEPHWVSRDGHRFICKGQLIDDRGNTHGGWHEYRFRVDDNGEMEARRRSFIGGRKPGVWKVAVQATEAPRRKAVFLLHPVREAGSMMAIRLPANSRAVEVLQRCASAQ
jgi:hypothetical protein